MDVSSLLKQVWNNPWLKKIPVKSLFATLLASIIHPALGAVGFQLSAAGAALSQVGFKLGEEALKSLLPSIVEAAKQGVEVLANWLEQALAEKPEVNEAAAQLAAEQARPAAESLQAARAEDKGEVAAAVGAGMEAYGGATAAIAEPYSAALKDVTRLEERLKEIESRLQTWSSQTMEARRGSLIADSEQDMQGPGEQKMIAEDNSQIIGAKQSLRGPKIQDNNS